MYNEIQLPASELKIVLTGLSKVVSKHGLPALKSARCSRDEQGMVTLQCTDLHSFVSYRAKELQPGRPTDFRVPLEPLVKTVRRAIAKDRIALTPHGTAQVLLRSIMGNISFEEVLDSSPAEDWPAIPRVDGDRIALDWAFKTALREALDCASTDDARIILNSAYLDVTDPQATYLIGTNGGHLYAANSFCVALSRSIIVPNEKFLSWPTFHDDGPWTLVASAAASAEEPCWIQVSSQRWTIVVRQPEGTYPNWKAVVPPPQRTCTQIELSDQALKQMQAFIPRLPGETEPNGPITLRIQNGCLVVGAQSGIMVPVPAAKVSGKPVLVSLNRTYLLKALRMGLDEIEISSADEVVVCQGKGKQLIIPPLRPDGPARIAEKTSPDPPLSPPQVTALLNEPEQENSCGEDNSQSEVVTVHAEPAEQPY